MMADTKANASQANDTAPQANVTASQTKQKAEAVQKPAASGFLGKCRSGIAALRGATESRLPVQIAYVYLTLPMLIFFLGWLKAPFSYLMEIVLVIGACFAIRHAPKTDISGLTRAGLPKILLMAVLCVVWVYLSGIGKFAFQNFDHMWRNAILEKLVNNDWPVIIPDASPHFEKPVAMIYYFTLWLPAACVGKIWGLEAAHTFLFYWCVIGVMIVMLLLCGKLKKWSPWIMLAFILFSGLDTVGDFILHNSGDFTWFNTNHIEHWATGFQLSSMSTQLFWVYNQAIPAWIITLLLLHQKDNRSLIFIYAFSLMGCTLPAIGLIPVVAFLGIARVVKTYDLKKPLKENAAPILKEALTFENAIAGVLTALVSYLFLKTNSASTGGFRMTDMHKLMMSYLLMILLEFLVYYFAIYSRKKRDPLYWISLISLLIVPMIRVGTSIDFVMRASIPALVILFILIMETLLESRKAKTHVQTAVITVLLALGSLTAYHEISRSVCKTIDHINHPENAIVASDIDLIEDACRRNFFGEYEDSFFFKYLAKKP